MNEEKNLSLSLLFNLTLTEFPVKLSAVTTTFFAKITSATQSHKSIKSIKICRKVKIKLYLPIL